jgi:hypothetical protein
MVVLVLVVVMAVEESSGRVSDVRLHDLLIYAFPLFFFVSTAAVTIGAHPLMLLLPARCRELSSVPDKCGFSLWWGIRPGPEDSSSKAGGSLHLRGSDSSCCHAVVAPGILISPSYRKDLDWCWRVFFCRVFAFIAFCFCLLALLLGCLVVLIVVSKGLKKKGLWKRNRHETLNESKNR